MNPQKKLIRAETYSANFNSRHARIIKSKSQPIQIDKLFQEKPQQTLTQSQQTEEEDETKIKKDKWMSRIFKNHPNILEIRERIIPITQKTSFGKLVSKSHTEVKDHISRKVILSLIMQHLDLKGFSETIKILESESKVPFQKHYSEKSRLEPLLKLGIKNIQSVWDLKLETKGYQRESEKFDPETEINDSFLFDEFDEEDEDENKKPDVDIWSEPPTSNKNLIWLDNNSERKEIKNATLNKLIEYLTDETYSNTSFMHTFLMTYQSFTTPGKLLRKLFRRYDVPRGKLSEKKYQEKKKIIQFKVCNVLRFWILNYFSDFNERHIDELQNFLLNIETKEGKTTTVKTLNSILLKKISGNTKKDRKISYSLAPIPIVPKNIFSPTLTLDSIDEEEVARQLTLIDFEMYSKIKPSELLNLAWSKPKFKHRATNVLKMIEKFNEISLWVAHTILLNDKVKKRAKSITRFVNIAKYCKQLNNLNGLMSIYAGLDNSAVYRLKFTFEELSKKTLEQLSSFKQLMSSSSSYKLYRETLNTLNPPCIPYLGIYLTDLTFIEEGNKDYVNGLVNFYKTHLISKVIQDVQKFQQKRYNFMPVIQISKFLTNFPKMSQDTIYELSMKVEPRNSSRSDIN
ncbi:ras guanine nucleotide exchange factor i-related [Anaeramoeba flamelloides]|uniref:Ras guanine nucleotide exchange factor i-related n=1 Tax=Anaeramoeba flamelloides TaxID=1746091 RepID=A0AAV7ZRF8_9EUKA|nr:ras guanine nucleotide exchange factor i-related [Anaeramoeba flamelloides]